MICSKGLQAEARPVVDEQGVGLALFPARAGYGRCRRCLRGAGRWPNCRKAPALRPRWSGRSCAHRRRWVPISVSDAAALVLEALVRQRHGGAPGVGTGMSAIGVGEVVRGDHGVGPFAPVRTASRIISAAFSAIIIVGVGIATNQAWHYRSIDDAQTLDALDPKVGGQTRVRIVSCAHGDGAHRVVDRFCRAGDPVSDLVFGLDVGARLQLPASDIVEGRCSDAPRPVQSRHQHPAYRDRLDQRDGVDPLIGGATGRRRRGGSRLPIAGKDCRRAACSRSPRPAGGRGWPCARAESGTGCRGGRVPGRISRNRPLQPRSRRRCHHGG